VSDSCLTPIQQFFSYIMARNKLIFNDMMMVARTRVQL